MFRKKKVKKQKVNMKKGQKEDLFDVISDEVYFKKRDKANDLCYKLNMLHPGKVTEQHKIVKKLFGKTGDVFYVIAPFRCDLGYNIEIGNNFYANSNVVILDEAKVTFGENVLIGPNCGFFTIGHPNDFKLRNKGLVYAYPITVGNNVWFGAGVQVLPGVNIGNNVVIGAGSLITKDIPDNSLAVGNPCKVIKKLTKTKKGNIGLFARNMIDHYFLNILKRKGTKKEKTKK